ncbi:MAG: hypothetical protein ACK51C_10915 [Brevundimonas sp.]|uniref:hypothetical protein n=1 Tax=Brevundimonas sp. TaxID=1871086 RepID=UPI00391B7829
MATQLGMVAPLPILWPHCGGIALAAVGSILSPYETLTFPTQAEREIDKDLLTEIGGLIVTAAMADMMLGSVLSRMVSGDQVSRPVQALSAGMDFGVKLAVARVLSHVIGGEEDREIFVRTCDRLQQLYQRRNDRAHCIPAGSRKGVTLFQSLKRDPKTGLLPPPKQVRAKQVRGWAHQITLEVQELDELLDKYGFPSS